MVGYGTVPAAQDGPRVVLPGKFPAPDLAKVYCMQGGAAKLLQTLLPGPGVQPDAPTVAAGQGTIVVSTSPSGPVLGVLAVYAPSSSGWQLEASLAPPASVTVADVFGAPLVTDGTSILADVAPSSGAPYLVAYDRTGSGWVQTQSLYSDPGDMGFTDLALSEGVLAAASATPAADAGASPVGNVYVFDRGKAGWVKKQILRASSLQPGAFSSVATDSKTLVAGAPGADSGLGAAYVFELAANGAWSQTAVLAPGDRTAQDSFGWSVAVDGDLIVVGVPGPVFHKPGMCGTGTLVPCIPGKTYLFERTSSGWEAKLELVLTNSYLGDQFGLNVSLSAGVLVSESQDDLFAYTLGDPCTTSNDCDGGTCSGGVCAQPAPCLPMSDAGSGDAGPDAPLDASDAGSAEASRDATPDSADAGSDAPGADAARDGGVGPARSVRATGGCGCRLARGREGALWDAVWLVGAALAMLGARRRRKPGPPAPI